MSNFHVYGVGNALVDLEGVDNSLRYQYRIYDLWLADRNSSHHRAMERTGIAVR